MLVSDLAAIIAEEQMLKRPSCAIPNNRYSRPPGPLLSMVAGAANDLMDSKDWTWPPFNDEFQLRNGGSNCSSSGKKMMPLMPTRLPSNFQRSKLAPIFEDPDEDRSGGSSGRNNFDFGHCICVSV